MIDLSKVRSRLAERGRFGAALLSEDVDTGVSIEYASPDRMLIRNLQGELPPNLFLENQTARFSTTLATDPDTWEPLSSDSGFLIYRILDPRYVLRYSELFETRPVDDRIEEGSLKLSLRKFAGIGIPENIVEALIRANEDVDLLDIMFRVDSELIPKEMAVYDFPPQPSQVTLRFVYPEAV